MGVPESDKPTVRYDAEGRVVDEPDMQARVHEEVEKEMETLQLEAHGFKGSVQAPRRTFLLSNDQHSKLEVADAEGDCCTLSNAAVEVCNEIGGPIESLCDNNTDCCQRLLIGQTLLEADRLLRK